MPPVEALENIALKYNFDIYNSGNSAKFPLANPAYASPLKVKEDYAGILKGMKDDPHENNLFFAGILLLLILLGLAASYSSSMEDIRGMSDRSINTNRRKEKALLMTQIAQQYDVLKELAEQNGENLDKLISDYGAEISDNYASKEKRLSQAEKKHLVKMDNSLTAQDSLEGKIVGNEIAGNKEIQNKLYLGLGREENYITTAGAIVGGIIVFGLGWLLGVYSKNLTDHRENAMVDTSNYSPEASKADIKGIKSLDKIEKTAYLTVNDVEIKEVKEKASGDTEEESISDAKELDESSDVEEPEEVAAVEATEAATSE